VNVSALLQDGARGEEADAGYDLRRDAGWVTHVPESVYRYYCEERRAETDYAVGSYPGGFASPLALIANQRAEYNRNQQTQEHLHIERERN
jgi:hypothetical protein